MIHDITIGNDEEYTRYELLVSLSVPQQWRLHDRKEHTYTWSMTMEEMNKYLRSIGVKSEEVPIIN